MYDYKKYRVVYLHAVNVLANSEQESGDSTLTQVYAALTQNCIPENIKFHWQIIELDESEVKVNEVFVE